MACKIIPLISREAAASIGLKRYFTGMECSKGHVAERYVKDQKCTKCKSIKNAKERKENHESIRSYAIVYAEENRARYAERSASWRRDNPEKQAAMKARWQENNPGKSREYDTAYRRRRYSEDIKFKCIQLLRCRYGLAIRSAKLGKEFSFSSGLGYTAEVFIEHIERQFLRGMSWANHGEWHIDHITPISKMVGAGITDPAIVNGLSNLRPIWAADNLSKGAKLESLL